MCSSKREIYVYVSNVHENIRAYMKLYVATLYAQYT